MDNFLFIAFPYLALTLAIGVGIYRRLRRPYTYSSLSSEILEKRKLFWGSVPFHYGLTLILLAHLLAAFFPGPAAWLLGGQTRRLVLEVTGMALGLYTLFGLVVLIIRRLAPKSLVQAATTYMDGMILFVLLVQIGSGIAIAIFDRWGGLWYLTHRCSVVLVAGHVLRPELTYRGIASRFCKAAFCYRVPCYSSCFHSAVWSIWSCSRFSTSGAPTRS